MSNDEFKSKLAAWVKDLVHETPEDETSVPSAGPALVRPPVAGSVAESVAGPETGPPPSVTPAVPVQAASGTDASATSLTPAATGRVLLIHGYSASGADLIPWREKLQSVGIGTRVVEIGNYVTLNNEVTIKDLGEAFDRALRFTPWSSGEVGDTWTFDAIVHSTGMLVIRQWLTSDPYPRTDPRSRTARLKHLVGLAPATFGSPQAKQGRSWLGALFKGNKHLGPDFLNAGNAVLDGLELGSRYTWNLTERDLLSDKPVYDEGPGTPYATVFIGNEGYSGAAALDSPPGSDGTVRWAGCALNTRKVTIDFRRIPLLTDEAGSTTRCQISKWVQGRLAVPMIAVDERNHGTIVSDPDEDVAHLISRFLEEVSNPESYAEWEKDALSFGQSSVEVMEKASVEGRFGGAGWQQLVVHMVDDHGDGVTDYNLQLFLGSDLSQSDPVGPEMLPCTTPEFLQVPLIVDTYTSDASYRCFYVRLSDEMLQLNQPGQPQGQKMWLEVIASSGSSLIEYVAYTGAPGESPERLAFDRESQSLSPVKLDLTALSGGNENLLYPFTTTLLEIFVEREPVPLDQVSTIFNFL